MRTRRALLYAALSILILWRASKLIYGSSKKSLRNPLIISHEADSIVVNQDTTRAVDGFEPEITINEAKTIPKLVVALKTGNEVIFKRPLMQMMTFLKPLKEDRLAIMSNRLTDTFGTYKVYSVFEDKQPPEIPRVRTNLSSTEFVKKDNDPGWLEDASKFLPALFKFHEVFPKAQWYMMIGMFCLLLISFAINFKLSFIIT